MRSRLPVLGSPSSPLPPATSDAEGPAHDRLGRALRDLRISVTDRCNFRCQYCMPKAAFGPGHAFLPKPHVLSFEEIATLAKLFVARGVTKLRLTGGEPLMRAQLPKLVSLLAPLGVEIALTTNGSRLAPLAKQLAAAGLSRVTVSLDALEDAVFRKLNDVDFPVSRVLEGISAAQAANLPVKVNAVIRRGLNENQVLPLAEHFRNTGIHTRFIEFMDVGSTNGWSTSEVVSAEEIVALIQQRFALQPVERRRPGDVAQRWKYVDGSGEIGIITSVTQPFCRDCTRARLSADGVLYTCLFATSGVDLKTPLREGASETELEQALDAIWRRRSDRYSELRAAQTSSRDKIEMSYIGG